MHIVDNNSVSYYLYSIAMVFKSRRVRSSCRSFFVMTLVISLLFLGNGMANAGQHICRMFASGGPDAAHRSAAGCCCCCAGKTSGPCAGMRAKCERQAQNPAPVAVSNTERAALHVSPMRTDLSLPTCDGGHAPGCVFEDQVRRPVNLNLLC